jgi:hypothetical protein
MTLDPHRRRVADPVMLGAARYNGGCQHFELLLFDGEFKA